MSLRREAVHAGKRLPPYARPIVDMLRRRLRPVAFGGAIVVALAWDLGAAWPRIVLPPDVDPHDFDLAFLRGLDLLVIHRPGHSAAHLAATLTAIKAVRPHVVTVVAVPRLVDSE